MTLCPQTPFDSLPQLVLSTVETVQNVAPNDRISFILPINLWVKKNQVQTDALVDSGAQATFINTKVVKNNNLETIKLVKPYRLINADETKNKGGIVTHFVKASLQIGSHKTTSILYVADIGKKDVIIGYPFLRKHNPSIDWQQGKWLFNRCPEHCYAQEARIKLHISQEETEDLDEEIDQNFLLDNIGIEDSIDPALEWIPMENLTQMEVALTIKEHIKPLPEEEPSFGHWDDEDEDVINWKSHVPKELWKFGKVFSKVKSERMPTRRPYDHAIDLDPQAELPKAAKIIPLSPKERQSLDEFLEEELRKGYIRRSKSPLAAPVFFVPKKDGKLRLCTDYRKLNAITIKNRYPIPRMTDLINSLSGAVYFTKIDLRWGYNNVRIKKGDEWKTAFITHRGLYEALVMYFGFTNAPGTFQAMMNEILKDLIQKGCVKVYLDDILIFTLTLEENKQITSTVLRILEENDLFAKPEKCSFFQKQIEYLGTIISHGSIKMDPSKVTGVTDWPTPARVKQVQAFLGLANFYRRFIQDFAKIAKPLTMLTRKEQKWMWQNEQDRAFKTLKDAFTSAPILKIPDDENPFRLETDASDFATGAVLSQLEPNDGLWHPVAFYSKSLNEHERNYDIYDKELLAIIRALEEYRQHLEGHPHTIEIWSDHRNLTYFKNAQKLTRRQARWSLFLTRFNFSLQHKPGNTMLTADPLSRRPDHEEGVNGDNEDRILLKPEYFAISAIENSHVSLINDEEILRDIKEALLDDEVTRDYKQLLQSGPREFKKSLEEWNYENGLLLRRGKVYIPKCKSKDLRQQIITMHHDLPSAGHSGRWKTCELVSRNYWWPNLSNDVKRYVTGCDTCQRMKNRPQKPYGPLMPNPIPEGPWDIITIDLITQLPEANGFNAICVVVCRLTKRARFFPITNQFSAKDLANLLYEKVWTQHGLPLQIISDRGTQFAAEIFQQWCKLLGIESSMSTAYHPQTDGQTERVNQTLEQYLRCYIDELQDDWNIHLVSAEFAYNNASHEGTKNSPFFVEYGRHPRGIPTIGGIISSDLKEIASTRNLAQEQAKAALLLAAERMKWYYDQNIQKVPFKVGDSVMLDLRSWKKHGNKLGAKYYGPLKIIEQLSPVTFKVEWPERVHKIHPVFHASKLIPYNEPEYEVQKPSKPPPLVIDNKEEYEVDKILKSRRTGRSKKLEYYIRWKGYGPNDDTWEPVENVANAKEAIAKFHELHPKAISSLSGVQT